MCEVCEPCAYFQRVNGLLKWCAAANLFSEAQKIEGPCVDISFDE